VTYLLAMLLPKTYRAEATVLLPNVQGALATRGQILPVSDVAKLFRSPELAQEAIQQLELDRKYGLTVGSLLEEHLNASVSRDSQAIMVTVGLPDAEAAKKACDFIAQEGARRFPAVARGVYAAILEGMENDGQRADKVYLQAAQELEAICASKQPDALRMRTEKTREQISDWESRLSELEFEIESEKRRIEVYTKAVGAGDEAMRFGDILSQNPLREKALQTVEGLETELTRFQTEIGLEQVRMQAKTLLALQGQRQSELGMLQSALTAQQERNASLRTSLEKILPTIQLERSLADSPELQQTVSARSGKPLQELLSLKMRETVLNPSYHSAYSGLVVGLAEEERLKGRITSIQEAIKTDDPRLAEVEGHRLTAEQKLRQLEMQRELAVKLVAATARYEGATLTSLNQEAAERLVQSQIQIGSLTAEAASLQEALVSRRAVLEEMERSLAEIDRKIGHLDLTIEVRGSQLQRITDARVEVELELQRVSRPAEVISAVAPDRPVWPRKGLLALVVASLVTLAIWAGLCRSRRDET